MSPTVPLVDGAITFGPFHLFPVQQTLLEADKPVRLGSRALEILAALVERPGELVTKRELVERVWPSSVVEEANLKVHIASLRRALGDGRKGNRYLVNVPGRGYKFVAPVVHHMPSGVLTPNVDVNQHSYGIPLPLSRILGRDDVVDTIKSKLSRSRIVTVVGPGGIGKTTVALAVAAKLVLANREGGCFYFGVMVPRLREREGIEDMKNIRQAMELMTPRRKLLKAIAAGCAVAAIPRGVCRQRARQ